MKRNSPDALRPLVKSMSPQEQEVAKQVIVSFNRKFGDYEPKTLKLFQFISDNTDLGNFDDEQVKNLLFPEMDEATFGKLTSRLREKLFESLILDVNLDRKGMYQPSWLVRQKARKSLITAEILSIRNQRDKAEKLIRKTIRECQKHELYDLLIGLNHISFINTCNVKGGECTAQNFEDFQSYLEKERLKKTAEMHMYKYAFYGINRASAKPNPKDVLKDIQKIEHALENGPEVPSAQYFLLQLKTVYWELKGNFNNQVRFARQLRHLFVQYPHLSSDIRNINAYLQEFTALLNLNVHKQALEAVREAQKLAVPGTSSYFEITKNQVYPLIHLGRLHEARQIIEDLLDDERVQGLMQEKLRYLLCVVLRENGQYGLVSRTLMELHELPSAERNGWNVGVRFMEIQNRLENERFDLAETQIQNLKRFMERHNSSLKDRKREVVILRILLQLSKLNFDYSALMSNNAQLVDLLQGAGAEYRWDPFGAETIPFDQWLCKMAGMPMRTPYSDATPDIEPVYIEK